MAITIATGTGIDVAKTYGAPINMTAITNASEAVATLAAGHGVVVGEFLEINSGWQRLDKRIARVKTVASNDVTLEGINTTSTNLYPQLAGMGTVRKITAWDEITQLREMSASGGEQQFADITTLADVVERQIPTTRSAVNLQFTVMNDPTLAWYATILGISEASATAAVRMRFSNGSKLVGNGYWSLQKTPNVTRNEALTTSIDLALVSDPTSYAS